MTKITLEPLTGRFWRMLAVRWQRQPFETGAHLHGGRWNAQGVPALYLSREHATAITEMQQAIVRPGTLVAFDVQASAIVDLTQVEGLDATLFCDWEATLRVERHVPPSWKLAERLIGDGAEGALVPSVRQPGGVNLVLWKWREAGVAGEGAELTLVDPVGDLRPPR